MTDPTVRSPAARLSWLRSVLGLTPPAEAPTAPPSPRPAGSDTTPSGGLRASRVAGVLSLAVVGLTAVGHAQDERYLKQAFEGQRVTVLIDMPATSQGIDLFPGSSRPLDFQKYAARLKEDGVSIKEGERSLITKIRVKDDLIEVQLGGGGYGTFGDVFGSALTNNGADSGAAQQLKKSNERTQRLASGSRFNLRYPNGVTPADLEPDAIIAALSEYATFPNRASRESAARQAEPAAEPSSPPAASAEELRKGMLLDEVERIAGAAEATRSSGPVETRTYATHEVDFYNGVAVEVRRRGVAGAATIRKGMLQEEVEGLAGAAIESTINGPVVTKTYHWQDGTLEADFVNGVLVGYRIVAR